LENTHNMGGGAVYPQDVFDEICDQAHARGLRVHLDGARLFNAAEALQLPVRQICAKADTVMFCLSKALGAPAGSMLAGPRDLIDKGRLYRKRLGGGMRQSGVLAAAGLLALEESPNLLAEDHANARRLAEGFARIPGISVAAPQTNIVVFEVANGEAASVSAALKKRGILINPIGPSSLRAVTHYDVTAAQCLMAVDALSEIAAASAAR
jgi:threonine aldolase